MLSCFDHVISSCFVFFLPVISGCFDWTCNIRFFCMQLSGIHHLIIICCYLSSIATVCYIDQNATSYSMLHYVLHWYKNATSFTVCYIDQNATLIQKLLQYVLQYVTLIKMLLVQKFKLIQKFKFIMIPCSNWDCVTYDTLLHIISIQQSITTSSKLPQLT